MAFNQYFNGKPCCADCKNGFGTHSLQVNKPATGFNRPIESRLNHQQSAELLRGYLSLCCHWNILEDKGGVGGRMKFKLKTNGNQQKSLKVYIYIIKGY